MCKQPRCRAYLALPCCQERFLLCCVVVCRGKECVVALAVGQCCSWGTVELSWGSFTCDVDDSMFCSILDRYTGLNSRNLPSLIFHRPLPARTSYKCPSLQRRGVGQLPHHPQPGILGGLLPVGVGLEGGAGGRVAVQGPEWPGHVLGVRPQQVARSEKKTRYN